jgi:hypothetical protein
MQGKHAFNKHSSMLGALLFGIGSGVLMNQLSKGAKGLPAGSMIIDIIAVGFVVIGLSWLRLGNNKAKP